jgi:hypothetical protein
VLPLLVADNRLTTQVPLPDLSALNQAELSALRAYLTLRSKEARKEATKLLGKVASVRDLWLKTVALKETATDEEREEVLYPFYQEVMRHPEVFVAYAWANSLATLDKHVWGAMLELAKTQVPEKVRKRP